MASVAQRKVVSPHDLTDLAEVRQRLADFEKRDNATAKPFQVKFARRDLGDLLAGSASTNARTSLPTYHAGHDHPKNLRNRPLQCR